MSLTDSWSWPTCEKHCNLQSPSACFGFICAAKITHDDEAGSFGVTVGEFSLGVWVVWRADENLPVLPANGGTFPPALLSFTQAKRGPCFLWVGRLFPSLSFLLHSLPPQHWGQSQGPHTWSLSYTSSFFPSAYYYFILFPWSAGVLCLVDFGFLFLCL